MDATPRWGLPLLFAGQAHKELAHNEALVLIDALLHGRVESAAINAPPKDPAPGQCWIVANAGQGAWEGRSGSVACWTDGGWRFLTPHAGFAVAVADEGLTRMHDGSQWRAGPIRPDGIYLGEERVVAQRQPPIAAPAGGSVIDAEARSTIAAILDRLGSHGLIVA
ncbi:DUF2793 domain-containing protein [uncultured Sphingobium sp.]|uniref:DUF2793 domain-containing protein n=1 Tax=uncultured Sphingobium sp. TaxID=316087 RepID=UPI00262A0E48|nr:DUF2793 domain-containing protein [uncultured Sphingobium sp.]